MIICTLLTGGRVIRGPLVSDVTVIRDRLLADCEADLSRTLYRLLGSQINKLCEGDLLSLIRELAVWPQNNLINIDWKTGSSLMSLMTLFDPGEGALNVSCLYLYQMCVKNWGPFMEVLGWC